MKTMKILVAVAVLSLIAGLNAKAQGFPWFDATNRVIVASVTNGQAIGLYAPEIRLRAVGSADTFTNSITIRTPYYLNEYILLSNAHDATNSILLTDAKTTLNLGADVVLEPGECILLKCTATNACQAVSIRN